MENHTIAIGHINPDTDSVLSAIVISQYSKKIFGFKAEPVVANGINNETKFVLDLLKIEKPRQVNKTNGENVVLVDTTEPGQVIEGVNETNVIAIVDHHNLGGLKSAKPIYVRVEPVGCTATVIYKILKEKKIRITKPSAVLMVSSILSDTLNFTSPTATKDDKLVFKELNKITKMNPKKFVKELFAAKSSLEGIATEDIICKDYKQFEMGSKKVAIGVWETTNPESVNTRKDDLMAALRAKKTAENLDHIFFLVVDILKSESTMYIAGEPEKALAEKVFGGKANGDLLTLKGVVSRKKQVVPPLMTELTK